MSALDRRDGVTTQTRVGYVDVMHGSESVVISVHAEFGNSSQLTPLEARHLAVNLLRQADDVEEGT